jgi:hypothetical protein
LTWFVVLKKHRHPRPNVTPASAPAYALGMQVVSASSHCLARWFLGVGIDMWRYWSSLSDGLRGADGQPRILEQPAEFMLTRIDDARYPVKL